MDFLIGITIFLLAFLFVLAFIPGMFAPYQSNSDELTMAADNAAVALVENLLIDDRHIDTRNGSIVVNNSAYTPGIIDRSKYVYLRDHIDETIKKSLGLGYGESDNVYNVQIELKTTPGNPDPIYNNPISPDGEPSGSNVGQSKRFVYVQNTTAGDYTMAMLTVRVW